MATKRKEVKRPDDHLLPGFILRAFQKKQVTIQVERQTHFTEKWGKKKVQCKFMLESLRYVTLLSFNL